ncbi:MAG: aminopeptidase [Longimicrobiales bacterium]
MSKRRTLVALALLALTAAASLTCSPVYVFRAGIEEGKILSRRKPIQSVIDDPSTQPEIRRKLGLVLQARDFAEHSLALDAGESYTTYSWVESDTLLMVLSAAYQDRFAPHTWWFPIVGRVPYKGFFDFDDAYAAADQLRKQGFDTYVRPSGAFSTLGWFNDPLLNTVLRYGDVSLTSTVIHELLHNTVFIPGHVSFNESFANFVGDRGAIQFFCLREGEDSQRCRLATAAWGDNLLFGEFLTDLVRDLESLYGRTDITRDEKLAQRERIFQNARTRFESEVEPRLQTTSFRGFSKEQLDNATLIGTRLYYDRLGLFDAVFERLGRDLPATIAAIDKATRNTKDPFAALEQLAGVSASGRFEE